MAVISTSGGWTAEYFDATGAGALGDVNFAGAALATDTLAEVQEFSFTDGFLDGGPEDNYAVSYAGTFTLDADEAATFNLKASGIAELWVDGQLVAQAEGYDTDIVVGPCGATGNPVCLCAGDKAAVAQVTQGTVNLAAGLHTIEVRFLDARGSKNDIVALDWRLGGEENGFTSMQLADPNEVLFDAEGDGEWSGLFSAPLLAIHSILTPDGKVLMYGANEQGLQGGESVYAIWDPETNEYFVLDNATQTDIFCSVPLIVPETGEILVIGGDTRGLDIGVINNGVNDVNTFDYQTGELTASATGDMEFARWYPTMITLPSGQLLILGGRDFDGTYVGYPEIYTPGEGWRTLTGAYIGEFDIISDYPRAWVTSDGRIVTFAAQGNWDGAVTNVYIMDPTGNGSVTDSGVDLPVDLSWYMPAVMYDVDKALIIAEDGTAWILDMSGGGVAFTQTEDVGPNRIWSDMTVMPDGRVLVTGGSNTDTSVIYNAAEDTSTAAMVWDPDTGEWTTLSDESTGRYYHSTLLMLADGTFLSSGGGAPGPLANTNSQIYTPDYLFEDDGTLADRPVIEDAPAETLNVGDVFQITVDDASAITELALMPFQSVTHSYNQSARRVELDFVQVDATTLEVTLPPENGTTPPGYWHLFALDDDGTPSVAATITIAPSEAYYLPAEMPLGLDIIANGDAAYNLATNEIILVPDEQNQMGTAGLSRRFDFSNDFYISFDLYMGNDDAGADGFAFMLHNDFRGASTIGSDGSYGQFGAYYTQFGLAIEFDVFDNGAGDLADDHTNIFDTETLEQLTAPVALTDLENNVWRTVEVNWDVATQTLVWSVDGVQMGQLVTDLANDHFNGSDLGWVTFAAATGGASNEMKVSLNAIDAVDENGAAVVGEVGDNDASFIENLTQHFTVSGDAGFGPRSRIELTEAVADQTGGAMSNKRVDITKDFAVSFDLMFGAGGVDGGDGAAFVFHNAVDGADALGVGGADLGARWLGSGLAIEIDTFENAGRDGDIAADHTAVFDTDAAVVDPLDPTIVDLDVARVLDPVSLGDVENGLWHRVEVIWDATAQTLTYSIDGVEIAVMPMDLVNDFLDGSPYAYFGWTAATGGIAHDTTVLPVSTAATFEDGTVVDDVREDNPDAADDNTAPIAQDFEVTLAENAAETSLTAGVLAGVVDPDGEDVRVVGFNDAGADGVVALSEGNLTYTPGAAFAALNAGEQALDTFIVNVADIHGAITPLTVTVTVTGIGDAPAGAGFVDQAANNFTVSGDADYEGDNGFLLTEAVGGQTGGAMSNERVDMAEDFEVAFDINFGAEDGADGMAFVFHNAPGGAGALGVGAADFGARYLGDGLAIEFDTFGNIGRDADIAADHTNIFDTDVIIVADAFEDSRVTDPTALADLEDGEDHRVVVSWDAVAQVLSYSVDGIPIATLTAPLVDLYFGGSQYVHFGWTAGTGGTAHESHVKLQELSATFEDGTVVDDVAGAGDNPDPVNTAPVAGDIAVAVAEDAASADLAPALVAAGFDADGDPLTVTGFDDTGVLGQVTLVGGQLVYDPNGAFDALDAGEQAGETFTVTVADGQGGEDEATVTVTVNGLADDTGGGGGGLPEPTLVGSDLGEVLRGDVGVDVIDAMGGDDRVYGAAGEDIILGGEGADLLKGNAGSDDLRGQAGDDTLSGSTDEDTLWGGSGDDELIGGADVDTFVFGVGDDQDVVSDFNAGAGEILRLVGTAFPDAAAALAAFVDTPEGATLDLGGGDVIVLEGTDVDELTVAHIELVDAIDDGGDGGDDPDPVNTAPVRGNVAAATSEDAPTANLPPALIAAAFDADGDAITVTGFYDTGLQGLLTLVGGQLVYDPNGAFEALNAGEQAQEVFTATIADGEGGEDEATITVTINGVDEPAVNTAPVAGDIGVGMDENVPATTLTPALIAAAFDADGDGLSVVGFDAAGLQGAVSLVGGQLYYNPNGAFDALDDGEQAQEVFTATIADGNGGEDDATITVTINGVTEVVDPPANTPPVAGDIVVAVAEDAVSGDLAPAAIAAGFDADGDPLDVTGFDATGTQGLVTLVGGQLVYDPNGAFDALNDGEQAVDSFDFIIDDGEGGQDVGTVTVTINGAGVPDGGGGGGLYGDPEPAPTVVGTEEGETVRGDEGEDVVAGLGGADRIFGGDGDDVVLGGEGDDTVKGNGGEDDVRGGAGDDTLYGNSDADMLWGGSGDDSLYGGAGGDVFVFGVGDEADTVEDFGNGDSLLFFGGVYATAAEAHAAAVETALGLVFDLGNGDVLTVEDEDKASLTVDDIAIL